MKSLAIFCLVAAQLLASAQPASAADLGDSGGRQPSATAPSPVPGCACLWAAIAARRPASA